MNAVNIIATTATFLIIAGLVFQNGIRHCHDRWQNRRDAKQRHKHVIERYDRIIATEDLIKRRNHDGTGVPR